MARMARPCTTPSLSSTLLFCFAVRIMVHPILVIEDDVVVESSIHSKSDCFCGVSHSVAPASDSNWS